MNTLSATTLLITHSLAWALLYSLWQGALIYSTLYILLKALPNVNARIKYYLSFGAVVALFLWFADTWVTQYQKLKGITVYITQSGTGTAATTTYSVNTIATDSVQSNVLHDALMRVEQYFPFIILLYAIGLAFMLFRFVVNVWQVRALSKQGIIKPDSYWISQLQGLQAQFDISRPVQLFFSSHVNVPMMLGIIKPIILLPVATINNLSTEQVEAILMHELAHIKRHDYLLNLLQTMIETILFFNPFVWLTSAIIRREREHCCDDLVVACSASPLSYVKALAILEQSRSNDNNLVLAATGKKKQLLNRIKRIMEMKKDNINYGQLTIIIVAIIAIAFSITMFTFSPSFAQQAKKGDSDTTTTRQHIYKYKYVNVDSNGNKTEVVKKSNKPLKATDDEDDDNTSVIINDDKGSKRAGANTHSYSYSYSNSDADDLGKAIKEIAIAATKTAADAIASIDFNEIEKELDDAQKEVNGVDWDKVRAEVKKGIADVDRELDDAKMDKDVSKEVKESLEKTKEALKKAEREMRKSQVKVQTSASAGSGKAQAYVTTNDGEEANTGNVNYESMLGKMEKEGLIDRSKTYKIVKENGTLYINGKQQPAAIYNKYKHYLNSNQITIKGHKGSLNISVNN